MLDISLSSFESILIFLSVSTVYAQQCEPSILQNRITLDCKGREFNTVPDLSSYNQVYDELTLALNNIQRVENSTFTGLRIRRLDLTLNPIIYVSPSAFQGLDEFLDTLLISFNPSLKTFPADIFQAIPRLRTLIVSGHGFTNLGRGAFAHLSNLSSLQFISGTLETLNTDCFTSQREVLTSLDLQNNAFSSVPLNALSSLSRLHSLNLAQNKITRLESESFIDLPLEVLDLNTQKIQMSNFDENAFRGLERTLKNLSLSHLYLSSTQLRAVKNLYNLIDLDLSSNKITQLDVHFDRLTSLLKLNLQDNEITSLSGSVFRSLSTLKTLNLANNHITTLDSDALAGLATLENLDLGENSNLDLKANSFSAQCNSLKSLTLQNTKFQDTHWASISELTELHDLDLSFCGINNIPDFIFKKTKKLRSIEMRNNSINTLTQRSFAGLENSLEILNLLHNRISTIDHCVFQDFTRINIFQLILQSNPLHCNCSLQWLYNWFTNVTRVDTNLRTRITWTCETPTNIKFRELSNSNFEHCDEVTQLPCEDWGTTTLPTSVSQAHDGEQSTQHAILSFWVNFTSLDSIAVQWDVSADNSEHFLITWEPIPGGTRGSMLVNRTSRAFEMTGLSSAMTYSICLQIQATGESSCQNATTSAEILDNKKLMFYLSIGGGAALLILLVVVGCCCWRVARSKPHLVEVKMKDGEEPKLGTNSKRFQRPTTPQTPEPGQLCKTKSLADQLEELTWEERYKIINLLTHSGGSVDSLDHSFRSLPRQNYVTPGNTLTYHPARKFAPELPAENAETYMDDEYYDEISEDEIL